MGMAFLLLRHRMLEPVHRYAGRKITTTGTLECSELVAVEASISSDLANRMHTAFLCFSMRMTSGGHIPMTSFKCNRNRRIMPDSSCQTPICHQSVRILYASMDGKWPRRRFFMRAR